MERNRKDRNGGVLDTVAELFDLPADLVAGLPHLEMMGSRQLYLEHHTGILAYSDDAAHAEREGPAAPGAGNPLQRTPPPLGGGGR